LKDLHWIREPVNELIRQCTCSVLGKEKAEAYEVRPGHSLVTVIANPA
jgi:hypothetical protein